VQSSAAGKCAAADDDDDAETEDAATCAICFGVIQQQVDLDCGHVLCHGCTVALAACSSHRHKCPLCRTALDLAAFGQVERQFSDWSLEDITAAAVADIDSEQAMDEFLALFPDSYSCDLTGWRDVLREPGDDSDQL
jgi:hypothetical protein